MPPTLDRAILRWGRAIRYCGAGLWRLEHLSCSSNTALRLQQHHGHGQSHRWLAAQTAQVFGEFAYAMALGASPAPVTVEPFANLAYVSVRTNGFSEGAGVAARSAQSGQLGILSSRLGVRAEMPLPLIAGVPATASALLARQHAVGDLTPQSTLSFTAARCRSASRARRWLADAAAVDVSLSYAGQWAANANENAVKGALIWRF